MNRGPSLRTIVLISVLCFVIFAGAYLLLLSDGAGNKIVPRGDVLAQPKTAHITLFGGGFEPKTLTIEKDTVVVFSNKGTTAYWIASSSNLEGFNSGIINPGQSYSFVFTEAGEWPFSEQTYGKFQGNVKVVEK